MFFRIKITLLLKVLKLQEVSFKMPSTLKCWGEDKSWTSQENFIILEDPTGKCKLILGKGMFLSKKFYLTAWERLYLFC